MAIYRGLQRFARCGLFVIHFNSISVFAAVVTKKSALFLSEVYKKEPVVFYKFLLKFYNTTGSFLFNFYAK